MVPGLIFPLGPAPVQWVGPPGRAGWEPPPTLHHTDILSFSICQQNKSRDLHTETYKCSPSDRLHSHQEITGVLVIGVTGISEL